MPGADGANEQYGFDAAAADFDALGRYLWAPIGAATVAATAPGPGERVLDACCGTGASALPAARAVGPDGVVDAVDVSRPMTDAVARASRSMPQLRSHTADVLTWPDGDYDVVQCALGIFFFPDMEAGARHLITRARPGGRVGYTIWRSGSMETAGRHLAQAVAAVTGGEVPDRRPHLLHRVSRQDTYADWLASLGLGDVRVAEAERSLPVTDELAWLIVLGSGFRGWIAQRPDDQVAAIRAAYLASLKSADVAAIDATTLIGTGTAVRAG
ncbi:methyltransferase family protein [Murinocardiopsis flavida]|uniref:Methyltransferase family protein n=1 Tax=Murinocardiopsis flavida TaxID=645275 RepID=A0A2P8DRZ3_9ACTN|nr:class I SAM-dependent methyltransferase [Murinocardiopsis flavida]PSK99993.1 methyltransferase family protein [Murinocardiopsis flavida]